MPTLYVTEPGSRIEKDYHRITVSKGDEVLISLPISLITDLVLVSSVGITTPAMFSLLDEGKHLSLVSSLGHLRGRLVAPEGNNILLRHKQYACSMDPVFGLKLCKSIISAKIRNSITFCRRMVRQRRLRKDDAIQTEAVLVVKKLHQMNAQTREASRIDTLRGLEGHAAREYFTILKKSIRSEFHFDRRSRRPPADPANALLSLAYTFLSNSIYTACEVVGLDPYDGFLHAEKYGRPALVLDLMEEFRSIIADSMVLRTVNNQMLTIEDFVMEQRESGPAFTLKKPAMRVFVSQYSRRINEMTMVESAGKKMSYQKVFEIQARHLRKLIEGRTEEYQPFKAR